MSLKIVIIGAGEVGYNLCKYLAKEDYSITVIDIDPKRCNKIKNTIDAHVIEGDASSQRIYDNIDMKLIDYFLPLTRTDEVNLVASKIASTLGVKNFIARLRNTEYIHKDALITPSEFGINNVTYPETAAQNDIESLIKQFSPKGAYNLSLVGPNNPIVGILEAADKCIKPESLPINKLLLFINEYV